MSYKRDGYAIEHNVLSAKECDELVEFAKQFEGYQQGSMRPAMQPHKNFPLFKGVMEHPKIIASLQQYLAGNILGLQTEFFYGKPGTPGFSAHQDNAFVQASYGVFASAWIALTDVSPEKGGLIIWKGSHQEPLLDSVLQTEDEHLDQDPNAYKYTCLIPKRYPEIHISLPKGSIVYIHGNLIHASNQNNTQEWRYVLLCTFIRENEYFRPGRYAKREAIVLNQPEYSLIKETIHHE